MSHETTPRISIGMPVYNSVKYLEAALDAILAQSYSNFELIISDNASTDQTPAICQAYAAKDRRIRYYRNAHNWGANPNINRVFKLSGGEYFKWAFYDDLLAPDCLARCTEVLDLDPDVVLCVPMSNVINENNTFLGVTGYKADATIPQPHLRFRNLVLNQDAGWEVFGLIRANILRKTALHGSYPGSDLVLLAELALHGRYHVLPEALQFPRIHPEQMWMTTPKERDRILFEDTALAGQIILPKWRWIGGYVRAIRNAPLNRYQRMHCYTTVVQWSSKPNHFRALGKDIFLAAQAFMAQSLLRRHKRMQLSSTTVDLPHE